MSVWEGTTEALSVGTGPSYDYVQSASGFARSALGISSDGENVFIALEDNSSGNQVVFKATRPASPTVSLIYAPGGGSAANIATTPNFDKVVFHGNFGTDIGVINHTISTDAESDVSPTSIGAKIIAPLKVDDGNDQHYVAINRNDQDAIETDDAGTAWSTLNAALGQTTDAMDVAFFGAYYQLASFFGGNDGTDENLEYTPNEFSNLREDTSAALKAVGSIVAIDIALDNS